MLKAKEAMGLVTGPGGKVKKGGQDATQVLQVWKSGGKTRLAIPRLVTFPYISNVSVVLMRSLNSVQSKKSRAEMALWGSQTFKGKSGRGWDRKEAEK